MYVYVVCVILYAVSILYTDIYIYTYNRDPYRGRVISSRYPFLCCPGMSCYGLLFKDAALVKTLGEICGAKAWLAGEICDDGHGWLSCQKCCVFSMHAHIYIYIYIIYILYIYIYVFMETSWRIRAKIMEHHGTSWEIMERINELRPGVATLASSPGRGHEAVACGDGGLCIFFSFRSRFW